jgi:tRNA(Ile)-lysidine synthase
MEAWEKFKKFNQKSGLIRQDDKVLLAVSGGPDSVCMLHLFHRLSKLMPLSLHVCTFDHGLRRESVKEVKLVLKYAKKFGIPADAIEIPVKEFSRKNKISLETAGRALRYQYLASIAAETGCDKVATAHNANDNAETVLMWLARGTGTDGLAGIPVMRALADNIKLIRPVLCLTRLEIVRYLKTQGLNSCLDRSNLSMDFTRNRLRRRLIPEFEKFNEKFIDHVFNFSKIMAAENDFFSKIADKKIGSIVKRTKTKIKLDLKGFFGYNKALQLRILKKILPEKRSQFHLESLLDWITSAKPAGTLNFSGKWDIFKSKDLITFVKSDFPGKLKKGKK